MVDEKYRIQLTGEQVDDALQQLNLRVAEGWAVGSRDGTAVSQGSQYYHNNAKYYAETSGQAQADASESADRAEVAAARAEAAVPAGTAGAVFFDRAQSLTDAQKGQVQKNIGAGATNPNLLDNPFFTVRQRGNGPFSGANVTGIDRWKTTNSNSTVTGKDGYITFTAASGGNAFLVQYTADDYEGTYTYSAYIRGSGAGYIAVTNADRSAVLSSKSFDNVGNTWTLVSGTFTTSGDGIGTFTIRVNAGTSIDIKCAKLEKARTSTLENDAPPKYKAELDKCKFYFRQISATSNANARIAYATSETQADIIDATYGEEMYSGKTPTITMEGSIVIANDTRPVTAAAVSKLGDGLYRVRLTTTGLNAGSFYIVYFHAGARLNISTEL